MQILTIVIYLLIIVATAIVEARPLEPDMSRIRLVATKKKDANGKTVTQRIPGHWKDPVLFNLIFAEANKMIGCLHGALQSYTDTSQPQNKALLDKYYVINDHQDRWQIVSQAIEYFIHTDNLMIFGDEFGSGTEGAFVAKQNIEGHDVYGIFFSKRFSNKGPSNLQRLSLRAQGAVLIHESIHALSNYGAHGDHVKIHKDRPCEFLSTPEYKKLKKRAKDENKPELSKDLETLYWRQNHMTGWSKMAMYCPDQMIGIPDATAAAGYECLYGHEPDRQRSFAYW